MTTVEANQLQFRSLLVAIVS